MRTAFPALTLFMAFALSVAAQTFAPAEPPVDPDVVFVPTPQTVVEAMLRLAEISDDDLLYDLGSGDGRIVITAAQEYGASGVGIDIDPARIAESKANAELAGVGDRVEFIQGDLFEADLRPATAVTLYLLNSLNVRLRPKLLEELRPGTPIVSHDFDMGEWEPDETLEVGVSRVFLWRVPADVQGRWAVTLRDGQGERTGSLEVDQTFQQVTGFAEIEDSLALEFSGRLAGEEVELVLGPVGGGEPRQLLTGRVRGDLIEGVIAAGNPRTKVGTWHARRRPKVEGGGMQK